jgi:hypothetical protein
VGTMRDGHWAQPRHAARVFASSIQDTRATMLNGDSSLDLSSGEIAKATLAPRRL